MSYTIPEVAKAVIGSAVGGLGAAVTALEDGAISTAEWLTVAIVALTALGAIFVVPNKAPVVEGQHRAEEGHVNIVTVLLVAVLVVVLLILLGVGADVRID